MDPLKPMPPRLTRNQNVLAKLDKSRNAFETIQLYHLIPLAQTVPNQYPPLIRSTNAMKETQREA
jgi:hypothetical protein